MALNKKLDGQTGERTPKISNVNIPIFSRSKTKHECVYFANNEEHFLGKLIQWLSSVVVRTSDL